MVTSPSRPTFVLLGGEGIGPEVVEATSTVLAALLPEARFERPIHGKAALDRCGDAMPGETRTLCKQADGVLFGATQEHCHPVLRYLRFGLETFANLRPARTLPGLSSPLARAPEVDLLIVRENLEGEYPGREGELNELKVRWPELTDNLGRSLPSKGLFTLRLTTEEGTRRVAETAARWALRRQRRGRPGKVTVVTKSNVLRRTDGLFRLICQEVLDAHGLEHDHFFVDDAARRLVAEPERFDVILTPNLFGDILSDVAAELVGGMGLAPSACLGNGVAYFEAVHGSAPDIAGQGIANPLATVLSAVLMLQSLGLETEALVLEEAVRGLLAEGETLTPDLGGTATTSDVAAALVDRVAVALPAP